MEVVTWNVVFPRGSVVKGTVVGETSPMVLSRLEIIYLQLMRKTYSKLRENLRLPGWLVRALGSRPAHTELLALDYRAMVGPRRNCSRLAGR
jgi:hypothetical protein